MNVKCTVNPYLPATRQRHLVYVLVEIDPGDTSSQTTPINLGLVVDASRSMSIPILTEEQFNELRARGMAKQKTVDGVKVWQFEVPRGFQIKAPSNMDFTKEALRTVAGYLRPMDCFSLIAFAEDALLMVGNTAGTGKDELLEAIDRLDRIDLGDETFMARGMELSYAQISPRMSAETITRMVVLTDGYTKEAQAAHEWSQRARKEGFVVSTMGLGLDFNEDLLISLADVSGGHAYFIEDPQEIPDAFRQELDSAQSVSWRDLSLALTLPTEVILRRAHRVRPAIAPTEATDNVLLLGDVEAGTAPAALLELVVPPRPAGTYRLAQITMRGRQPGERDTPVSSVLAQRDVIAHYTEKSSLAKQTNPHLMSIIQAVSAFKLQSQAFEEAQRGNVVGATKRLRAAGERLIEMGQDDLGHTMLVEANLLEKEGQLSSEGTKKLRYGTRKLR